MHILLVVDDIVASVVVRGLAALVHFILVLPDELSIRSLILRRFVESAKRCILRNRSSIDQVSVVVQQE